MARQIQILQARATSNAAAPVSQAGALAYFYRTDTTDLVNIWSDPGYDTPLANPLTADAAGRFVQVFYEDPEAVKLVLKTSGGATIDTLDPCPIWNDIGSDADEISFDPTPDVPETDVQAAIAYIADRLARGEFGDGSVILPSVHGTDTDSGMSFPSANQVAISAAANLVFLALSTSLRFFQGSTATPGDGNTTVGASLTPASIFYISNSNGKSLNLNRNGTDGAVQVSMIDGVTAGSISVAAAGPSTSYGTSSDPRLKDIIAWPEGFDALESLRIISEAMDWFTWKNDPDETPQLGAMADKMQAVAPYAVMGVKDAVDENGVVIPMMIDWSKHVPGLIVAFEAMRQRLVAAEDRIAVLEAI